MTQSTTTRPTATVQDLDGRPLDRDTYAAVLAEQADPTGPAERDRVRLTYPDDGRVHSHVTGQVRRQVLRRAERPRLALLTASEAHVIAALLGELAGVYPESRWAGWPAPWPRGSTTGWGSDR